MPLKGITPLSISAVILTHQEELNLPACLSSLEGWCGEIFVVDSGSTDQTAAIAEKAGATVVQHLFETYARQWDWALRNLPLKTEWVLAIDADQRISTNLRDEMVQTLPLVSAKVEGFYLPRKQIFRGQWIRYGGYYPKCLLKLFRLSKVVVDLNDLVEHHFYVRGRTERFRGDLVEDNQKERDLSFWCQKHLKYAAIAAEEEWCRRAVGWQRPIRVNPFGTPDQRTIFAKRMWDHLPLYLRSFLYFGYRYFLQLGFLDGREGLRFHLLQGLWYRLLIDAQLDALLQQRAEGKERR